MSGFQGWLLDKANENYYIFIKRLSANDTGATGGHQVGLYIPSEIVEELFPSINHRTELNPSVLIQASYASHTCPDTEARAIYYNNKFFGGTRNEKRITRWGPRSPLQNPENTGALTILVFEHKPNCDSRGVDIWVCNGPDEEDIVESVLGEIIPGTWLFGPAYEILGGLAPQPRAKQKGYTIPKQWEQDFPSGSEIIKYSATYYTAEPKCPDEQLLKRRHIEYDIFLMVEEIHVLDTIRQGFESVNDFIALANSVSNRRKSRAGRSLELHLGKVRISRSFLPKLTR